MINLIDIEASGLHQDSHPIEIAILVDGNIHEWLISPLDSWSHWDTKAETDCHGISQGTLVSNGTKPVIVANALNNLLSGEIIYSDAEVWDEMCIKRLFKDTEIICNFVVHPVQDLMSPNRAMRFNHLKSVLNQDGKIRHRARHDVLQLAGLAKRFMGGDLSI